MVSAAIVSACLVALGCLDAVAPGGVRQVSLSIVPVFEGYGPLDGTPSDVDSFRVTVSNPPFPDTVIGVKIPEGQDSIELRVPVTVSTGRDTVIVGFRGYNSTTGLLLYEGTQEFIVLAGIPAPGQPVQAAYVGPGRSVRSISIGPDQVALRPGGAQQFTYTAFDTAGAEMPDDSVPVHFVSTNTSVVRVNSAGRAEAVADGTADIIVACLASNAIRDTARVTVSTAPPLLVSIAVAPGFSVMLTGGNVTLSVTGKDAGGASTTVTGLSYTSRSPSVATVNATTGLVTGVAGGTAVIVASAPGGSGAVLDSMAVAVAASGVSVASAIADGRAFDVARVGDTVRVLVAVDLRGVLPEKIGSYLAQLNWSTTALRYVRSDPVAGGFVAATLNETSTGTGQLRFGAANAAGSAGPSVGLATVVFVGNAAGTSTLTLALTDLSASGTFNQLLAAALIYSGTVRVQ